MFAIGFDLLWHKTKAEHPRGVSQAYADSMRDVRAFKVEHWSDFTNFMKT